MPPLHSSRSFLGVHYPPTAYDNHLYTTMSSGQFFKTAQNGVNIYLRLESNTFRRLPLAENQAALLGRRVAEEYEKDVAKDPAIGEATQRIMVE